MALSVPPEELHEAPPGQPKGQGFKRWAAGAAVEGSTGVCGHGRTGCLCCPPSDGTQKDSGGERWLVSSVVQAREIDVIVIQLRRGFSQQSQVASTWADGSVLTRMNDTMILPEARQSHVLRRGRGCPHAGTLICSVRRRVTDGGIGRWTMRKRSQYGRPGSVFWLQCSTRLAMYRY